MYLIKYYNAYNYDYYHYFIIYYTIIRSSIMIVVNNYWLECHKQYIPNILSLNFRNEEITNVCATTP